MDDGLVGLGGCLTFSVDLGFRGFADKKHGFSPRRGERKGEII
jgi:hypothetical protein